MAYKPTNVFIKENDEYIEITNEEHERRKATDEQYAQKLFIPMHGMLMEVDEGFYKEFYRQKDRDEYLTWRTKNKDVSYNDYDTEECSGEEMLVDPDEDVATQVTDKLMLEKLRFVLPLLPEDEYKLIHEHFFLGISQVELGELYGKNQSNISRKITRILEKLKNFLEN